MNTVSIGEGIQYGFKIMSYYIAVILIGNLISLVGFLLLGAGMDAGIGESPNWLLVLLGLVFLIGGLLTVFAGIFGAVYKLIADGVARGVRTAS